MVYDLICEGPCNPNIEIVDRLAAEYMSDRNADRISSNGRRLADDFVMLQRKLKYTPHLRDDFDPRFVVCGFCASRRKFGG